MTIMVMAQAQVPILKSIFHSSRIKLNTPTFMMQTQKMVPPLRFCSKICIHKDLMVIQKNLARIGLEIIPEIQILNSIISLKHTEHLMEKIIC